MEGSRRKERKTSGSELAIVVKRGRRQGLEAANRAQAVDAAAVAAERPWHWPVATNEPNSLKWSFIYVLMTKNKTCSDEQTRQRS